MDIFLDEDVDLFAVVSLVKHEKGVYGYNAGVAERGDEGAIANSSERDRSSRQAVVKRADFSIPNLASTDRGCTV